MEAIELRTEAKAIRFLKSNVIILILIALVAVFAVLSPNFFTVSNLVNILRQCSVYAILSFGMTFVIISLGIDLSSGSVLALVSCVTAMALAAGANIWVALIVGVLTGAVCGAFNGVMIAIFKIPFFLATVAMMFIARGLALVITHESTVSGVPKSFAIFGGTTSFPIPPQLIIAIIVFVILFVVLNQTKLGRYTFAIGSNEETCRLSGVNVEKYKILIYMVSGICSGVAGVVMVARMATGSPIVADGFEMDAICAVAIGGTSMLGGSGSLSKSAIGAVVLTVISVGLNIVGVSSSMQRIVKGGLILLVVAIDMMRHRSKYLG